MTLFNKKSVILDKINTVFDAIDNSYPSLKSHQGIAQQKENYIKKAQGNIFYLGLYGCILDACIARLAADQELLNRMAKKELETELVQEKVYAVGPTGIYPLGGGRYVDAPEDGRCSITTWFFSLYRFPNRKCSFEGPLFKQGCLDFKSKTPAIANLTTRDIINCFRHHNAIHDTNSITEHQFMLPISRSLYLEILSVNKVPEDPTNAFRWIFELVTPVIFFTVFCSSYIVGGLMTLLLAFVVSHILLVLLMALVFVIIMPVVVAMILESIGEYCVYLIDSYNEVLLNQEASLFSILETFNAQKAVIHNGLKDAVFFNPEAADYVSHIYIEQLPNNSFKYQYYDVYDNKLYTGELGLSSEALDKEDGRFYCGDLQNDETLPDYIYRHQNRFIALVKSQTPCVQMKGAHKTVAFV